ncbi:MAG: hypothetical protein R3F20_03240 [Planctomycetota bacterium]
MADLFDWLDSVAFPIAMDLALQSALVLLLVALAARLMRRGPAAGRHALWLGGFALLLVLPAAYVAWPKHSLVGPEAAPAAVARLDAVAPSYLRRVDVEGEGIARPEGSDRGLEKSPRAVEADAGPAVAGDASRPVPAAASPATSERAASSSAALGWRGGLVALWGLGALVALTRLALGRVRLARWIRRSRPAAPALREIARRAAARIGRRPRAPRLERAARARAGGRPPPGRPPPRGAGRERRGAPHRAQPPPRNDPRRAS